MALTAASVTLGEGGPDVPVYCAPCPGEFGPHDEPCELDDYLALADDEKRCCVRHHPDARRHDPDTPPPPWPW
jgi:hypothetical protein